MRKYLWLYVVLNLFFMNFLFAQTQSNTITLTGTLRDFNQNHVDFEPHCKFENNRYDNDLFNDGKEAGLEVGNILERLGSDKKPRVNSNSENNFKPQKFEEWYNDVDGVNMSMPYSITLTKNSDGLYEFSSDSFFPLDGKLFGTENYHGIKDSSDYDSVYDHNFHMTYELHTEFTYTRGQEFIFTGDDDVWVFIDNKLAIDIGGIHGPITKSVNLDDLGLVPGQKYDLDFFWAERHTVGSNFKITTSIVLESMQKSISGTVYNDKNADNTQKEYIENAKVILYQDSNQNGDIDSGDVKIAETISDANGNYSFNVYKGDYFVVVDSKSLSEDENIWAEQTYSAKGGYCSDGNGGTKILQEAGECFGGRRGNYDDNANELLTSEHITKVTVNDEDIRNLNFGFSFNVVANNEDTGQGSLRQFIINANEISGENIMKFRPSVPKNESSWWSIKLDSALPKIIDNGTVIDGSTLNNENSGTVGHSGESVGLGDDAKENSGDEPKLPSFERVELEIDANNKYQISNRNDSYTKGVFFIEASNSVIRNIAVYNASNEQISGFIIEDGVANVIEKNFIGVRADGTNPNDKMLFYGIFQASDGATQITENYIAYIEYTGIWAGSNSYIAFNELYKAANTYWGDAITTEQSNGSNIIIEKNWIEGASAYGVESWNSPSEVTIINNTIISNGQDQSEENSGENGGIRIYGQDNTVEFNIIKNHPGAGVVVVGDKNGNKISKNAIYDNGGLGIDIDRRESGNRNGDGINENDGQKIDGKANKEMDYPVFTVVQQIDDKLHLEGYVGLEDQKVTGVHLIEVYEADDEEGKKYIGSFYGSSDGTFSGDISYSNSVGFTQLFASSALKLVATATDSSNNTSEFSAVTSKLEPSIPPVAVPDISISGVRKYEGNSGTVDFVFKVTLDKPAVEGTGFWFTVTDGSDGNESEYQGAVLEDNDMIGDSGWIDVPLNATSYDIVVKVNGDTKIEDDERFFVDIYSPDNATISDENSRAEGIILNDDIAEMVYDECKAIFSTAVGSTKNNITINGTTNIFGSDTVTTQDLTISGTVKCDNGVCKKSNTLAKKLSFIVEEGSGRDGVLQTSLINRNITISEDKEYSKVSFGQRTTLNVKDDVTIKVQGDFELGNDCEFNIDSNVVLYADKITINSGTKININGSLKLIANEIYLFSSSDVQNQLPEEFVVLSKGILEINQATKAKGIFYAGGKAQVFSQSRLSGVITANEMVINSDVEIEYDEDAVNSYCKKPEIELKPFDCDGTMYLSNANEIGNGETTSDMYLHSININVNPFAFPSIGDAYDKTYNGLAYNPIDNLLYANFEDKILKIGSDGEVAVLHKIANLSQGYSATFDKDGNYYLGDWSDWSKINVIDIKKRKIIKTIDLWTSNRTSFIPISSRTKKKIQHWDMTIDKSGEFLYMVNVDNGKFTKVEIESGRVTELGDSYDGAEAEVASIYCDVQNRVFIILNSGGFYEIDPNSGKRYFISHTPQLSGLNDGANCPNGLIGFKDFGDAPESYGEASGGIIQSLKLGERVDHEDESQFSSDASGDDKNDNYDDEDGVDTSKFKILTEANSVYSINDIKVINTTGNSAYLYGWIDFDRNGIFDENEKAKKLVPTETNGGIELTWQVPSDIKVGKTFLRIIISNDPNLGATGESYFGEVEDYEFEVNKANDFDAFDVDESISHRVIKTKEVNEDINVTIVSINKDTNTSMTNYFKDVKVALFSNGVKLRDYVDVNLSTGFKDVSFNGLQNVYKNVNVVIAYTDDFNITREINASDAFAIRPHSYGIKVTPSSNLIAGEDFNITISALSHDGNITTNYEENATVYKIDHNETDVSGGCKTGVLKYTQVPFVDGVATFKASYHEIGKILLRVDEVDGQEFAFVDRYDGSNSDRFISGADVNTSEFNANKISLNWNFTNRVGSYTYYSNSPIDMGAELFAEISVEDKNGTTLKNFTKGCVYAKDVFVKINYAKNGGTSSLDPIVDFNTTKISNVNVNASDITYRVKKDSFISGDANATVYINYPRAKNIALEPSTFMISDINTTLVGTTISHVDTNDKNVTFVYARAHVADIVGGKVINIPVDYEVYCKNCNRNKYAILTNKPESRDSVYWYRIPSDMYTDFDSVNSVYGGASAVKNSKTSIVVTASKVPHKNIITYVPKDYLLYDRYSPTVNKHKGKTSHLSNKTSWAGKGKTGFVVDENISTVNESGSIDW